MGAILDRLAPLLVTLARARAARDAASIRAARFAIFRLKAQELADVSPAHLTRGEWTVTFSQPPRVVAIKDVPLLEMRVVLRRGGVRVPIDPHLRFVNPPVRVPDGGVDAEGNRTFRDDPAAALATIVWEALAGQVAELRQ